MERIECGRQTADCYYCGGQGLINFPCPKCGIPATGQPPPAPASGDIWLDVIEFDRLTTQRNDLLAALEGITLIEPGSRGAYAKFIEAKMMAAAAIAKARGEIFR